MCIGAAGIAYPQALDRRQAVIDGVDAAGWQARLDLFHLQLKQGQADPEAVKRSEKETAAVLSRYQAKWAGSPYRSTFASAFLRVLKNPAVRDQVLAEAEQGTMGFQPPSFFSENRDVILVFGAIAIFLAFGAYLKATRPQEKSTIFQRPQEQPSDTHGSASYAEPTGGIPDNMYVFNGVFFGKSSMPGVEHIALDQHQGAPICSTPENHTLIVARTRTGKGTRVVIPTLLRYVTGSALVIDPKGENAAVTARARQTPFPGKDFHQTVHIINPWGELAPTFQKLGFTPATYNPLDILDRDDPNAVATAQALAAAIWGHSSIG